LAATEAMEHAKIPTSLTFITVDPERDTLESSRWTCTNREQHGSKFCAASLSSKVEKF
jgi:hypothetical protein